jgi:hypothetical protein
MDTSEARITSGEPDIDARPKYHSWEMQPLGPIRPLTQDAAAQHPARDELHIHLHTGSGESPGSGSGEGDEEEPYEMEGEEGEYEEGEGEGEEPSESCLEMISRIEEIAAVAGELAMIMMGSADGRRRQHTRDTRSVPSPSEFSYLSGHEYLSAGERRRVIADGREHLRQKTIAERVTLNDYADGLSDMWDRQLEAEKRDRK